MGVVELHGEALVKGVQGVSPHEVDADHVLERAGDEEVLLREAELLADLRLVVGVEDLADRFGNDLLVDGLVVVADVEGLEIEGFDGL